MWKDLSFFHAALNGPASNRSSRWSSIDVPFSIRFPRVKARAMLDNIILSKCYSTQFVWLTVTCENCEPHSFLTDSQDWNAKSTNANPYFESQTNYHADGFCSVQMDNAARASPLGVGLEPMDVVLALTWNCLTTSLIATDWYLYPRHQIRDFWALRAPLKFCVGAIIFQRIGSGIIFKPGIYDAESSKRAAQIANFFSEHITGCSFMPKESSCTQIALSLAFILKLEESSEAGSDGPKRTFGEVFIYR